MENLKRLIEKAQQKECRLTIEFDPSDKGEEWGLKFHPVLFDDGHYYAYNSDLEMASRQLLDELRGNI